MHISDRWQAEGNITVRETGVVIPGLVVELWDRDLLRDDPLGQTVTDRNGRFVFQYRTQDFSDGGLESQPDLYVRVWMVDKRRLLLDTRDVPRENVSRQERLDLQISCWLFDKSDPVEFVVLRPRIRGLVYRARSETVVKDVTIRLSDAESGRVVAEGVSGVEGAYSLWFDPPRSSERSLSLDAFHKGRCVLRSQPVVVCGHKEVLHHIYLSEELINN